MKKGVWVSIVLLALGCGSSATDPSDPVSLPTPFSGAVATQPSSGKSIIVGKAGSVSASATVTLSLSSSASVNAPLQLSTSSRCSGTTTADANGFWTLEVDAALGDKCKITTSDNLEGLVVVKDRIIGLGFQANAISLSTNIGYFGIVGKDIQSGALDTTTNTTKADDRGVLLTLLESCNSKVGRVANCCDYTTATDIANCVGERYILPQNPGQSASIADDNGNGNCKSSSIDYLDDPQTIAMAFNSDAALVVDRDNACVEDVSGGTSTNRGGALMTTISSTGKISLTTKTDGSKAWSSIGAVTGGKFDAEDKVSIFGQDLTLWDPQYRNQQTCSYLAVTNTSSPNDFTAKCGTLSSNISGTVVTSRAVEYVPALNRAVQIIQYTSGTYLYVWNTDNLVANNGSAQTIVGSPVKLSSCTGAPIDVVAYHIDATKKQANLIWTDGSTESQSICTVQVDLDKGVFNGEIKKHTAPGVQPWDLVLVPKAAIAGGENATKLSTLQSTQFVRAYFSLKGSDKLGCIDLSETIGQETVCSSTCTTGAAPTALDFDVGTGDLWVVNSGQHTVQIIDVDDCE